MFWAFPRQTFEQGGSSEEVPHLACIVNYSLRFCHMDRSQSFITKVQQTDDLETEPKRSRSGFFLWKTSGQESVDLREVAWKDASGSRTRGETSEKKTG